MLFCRKLFLLLFFINHLFGAWWFQKDTIKTELVDEEVYLSIRYQGVIDDIVMAYYDGERFYLPLTEMFDLLGINYELDPKSFSVSGFYITQDQRYTLDFHKRFATLNDQVWNLDINDFKIKGIDFYVEPEIFREIFDLFLTVDLSYLNIQLETLKKLPIVTRHKERQKLLLYQRYAKSSKDTSFTIIGDRDRQKWDGVFADYNMANIISSEGLATALNVSLGGEFLYGDVQGTFASNLGRGLSDFSSSDIRWRYANDASPWFKTVTLGQQSVTGLQGHIIQGMHVTNEPLYRERSYDVYVIDGLTDPEADVELFQDGRLVDVTKADDIGYYRFLSPLNYGVSNFKIRIYGRQGRVIEMDRQIQIPFNFLPVNEIRYNAMFGKIADPYLPWSQQDGMLNTSVAMGLKNWLTARLGMEYIDNTNNNRPLVYTRFSSRLANDLLFNLDAALTKFTRLTFKGIGPNTSSVSVDYTNYNRSNLEDSNTPLHKLSSNYYTPFQLAGIRFSGRATLSLSNYIASNQLDISADITQLIRSLRLRYGFNQKLVSTDSSFAWASDLKFSATYSVPRLPRYNAFIRGSYFRAEIDYSIHEGQLGTFGFQYVKNVSERIKLQSFARYSISQPSLSMDIGLIWDFGKVKSTTNYRSRASSSSIYQTLRGSLGYDRNYNELIWDNRNQVGRAGVSVRMFIDANGNGKYDFGEEIIPGDGVLLQGGSGRKITKSGVTRLTQLQPYRLYNFTVNEAQISNPTLVPVNKDFSAIPDPNQYKRIDLPFFTSAIIEGRVERKLKGGILSPVAGLKIHVRSLDSDFETIIRTFGDGTFYAMEIPPGKYEAWIDQNQLVFLRTVSSPERQYFSVQPMAEGDYIEGLDFILE